MKMQEPLVSIIVPVYNVKSFLNDLLISLNLLTYKNIEILLIDDGSNDGSELILNKYAQINNKAKIIHQKNAGVANARNNGISIAKGEYIYFCDSDDYLHPQIISILIQMIIENNVDISICRPKKVKEKSKYQKKYKLIDIKKTNIYEGKDQIMAQLVSGYLFDYGIWNKIYDRRILMKFKNYPNVFDEKCIYGEDIYFLAQYFAHCNTVSFTKNKLYYYRQRKSSVLHSNFKEKFLTVNFDEKFYSTLDKSIYKESQIYFKTRICMENMDLIFKISQSKYVNKEKIKEIYEKYKNNLKYFIHCDKHPWYRRYFMWFPRPFLYLMIKNKMK